MGVRSATIEICTGAALVPGLRFEGGPGAVSTVSAREVAGVVVGV